jgi:hypothetical protein
MATLENTALPRRESQAGGALDDETRQQVAELNMGGIEVIQAALVAAGVVGPDAAGPGAPGAADGRPAGRRPGARRGAAAAKPLSRLPAVARRMSVRAGLPVTLAVPGRSGVLLPDAIAWSGTDWLALDALGRQRLAACPYLLFEVDFAGLLGADGARPRAVQESRGASGEPGVAAPFAMSEGRRFARLLFHYAWHLARSSPTVAAFAFGAPLAVVEPLRTLGLARVEALATVAGSAVRLRWDHEPLIWIDWLSAARADDPAALWAAQLRGLQRIAGVCREVAASV